MPENTRTSLRAAWTLWGPFAIVASWLAACGPVQSPPSHAAAPPQAGATIFAYPWVWTDEKGQRVAFSQWRGQALVVTAIYTSCKSTCPRTMGRLQQMSKSFRRDGRPAQFFLVTLDPSTDTPEVLRGFKTSAGLPDAWHLLNGSVPDTRELTDILDIHVLDDGPHLMHDAKIVVFDARGNPSRSFSGWALSDEGAPP